MISRNSSTRNWSGKWFHENFGLEVDLHLGQLKIKDLVRCFHETFKKYLLGQDLLVIGFESGELFSVFFNV